MCVCVSVTVLVTTYLVYISKSEAIYGFLWAFKDIYCVDFAENILFGSYGVIYLPR